MAVVSGLASADKYPALTEALKKEYHASPYMEKYVLEALFVMGQPEAALHRIHERYAKMMGYKDYTTLFEGWGIGVEGFRWRYDQPCLERRTADDDEPEGRRHRTDLPGFRDFPGSPATGQAEARRSLAGYLRTAAGSGLPWNKTNKGG